MNIHRLIALSILLASLVGTVLCQSAENETAGIIPSLTVADQTAVGDSMVANVTVAEAISDGPGWVVIHNNLFGHPGGGWIHSCR